MRYRRGTTVGAVTLGLIIALIWVYRDIVFGDWSFSYTNCLYRWDPFVSSGVQTQGYCYSDMTDNVLPIAFATIHQGIFTDWVPSFSIGSSQGMNLYLSPVNYLYMLPLSVAMPLIAIVKIVVSFFGMFSFLRQLGYSARGGFLAGITYAMSAAMICWQGWPHTEVGMWAPWLFVCIDKAIHQVRTRWFVLIAVLTFLMLSAGMPTFAAYFFYVAVIYAMLFCVRTHWQNWRTIWQVLIGGVIAMGIGALMSLPYTGELLSSVGSNGYSDSRSSWSTVGLDLPQLKTLVFPFLSTTTTLNNIESMLYTGVLAVVTLGLTVIHIRRKPRVIFFAVTGIIVLLLLFTPALDWMFTRMPMINTSYKFRIVIMLNFVLAVVFGVNMDDMLTTVMREPRTKIMYWALSIPGLVVFAALWWWTRDVGLSDEAVGGLQVRIACMTVILYVLILGARTVIGRRFARISSTACAVLLCCAVVMDCGYFASQYVPLIEKSAPAIPEETETIQYLREHTKNGEKIVGKDVELPVDSGMFYGLRDIRGHGFLMTEPKVQAFYTAIDDSAYSNISTNTTFISVKNENMLRYIGVKYVVSSEELESDPAISSGDGMKAVGDDGLLIKEIEGTSPDVQLVGHAYTFDTNQEVIETMSAAYMPDTVFFSEEFGAPENVDSADADTLADARVDASQYAAENTLTESGIQEVQREADGDMTIRIDADTDDRFLLINEYDDGQWVAYVDGQETEVYTGNGLFRAIPIEAGTHTVTIRHESKELRMLFVIAGVAFALLIIVAACARWIDTRLGMSVDRSTSTTSA